MKNPHVVVAGAGCAGLAAAYALLKKGCRVTLLEGSDRIGGLAGGVQFGGNTYEYGPHIFHTTDPEILRDVREIAGHVLIPFEKTIKIKFLGKYFDFPLSIPDILLKLPIKTVLSAVFSFLFHFTVGCLSRQKPSNSEDLLKKYYGDVLYRIFFKDYIHKVWGIPPKQMAASFAKERIPRFDLLDLFGKIRVKIFGVKPTTINTESYVEKVEGINYTTKKGFCLIADAYASKITELGGVVQLNSKITSVIRENRKVTSVVINGAQSIPCDFLISTIPVSILPGLIAPPLSVKLLAASKELQYRGICFVGILVSRKNVLPASFMYFRDKLFNRVTDLGQFEVEIEPSNATILIAEVMCQKGDDDWNDDQKTKTRVIQELCDEGLIQAREVLQSYVFKTEFGYPIYKVGYEANLRATLDGLKNELDNLITTGRQGRFAYVNTHVAIKMGYEAARKVDSSIQ